MWQGLERVREGARGSRTIPLRHVERATSHFTGESTLDPTAHESFAGTLISPTPSSFPLPFRPLMPPVFTLAEISIILLPLACVRVGLYFPFTLRVCVAMNRGMIYYPFALQEFFF